MSESALRSLLFVSCLRPSAARSWADGALVSMRITVTTDIWTEHSLVSDDGHKADRTGLPQGLPLMVAVPGLKLSGLQMQLEAECSIGVVKLLLCYRVAGAGAALGSPVADFPV